MNGYRDFVCLIGSDEGHACDLLDSIKTELEANESLLADYPEACFPIQALYDAALRYHGTWRAALTAAGINLSNVSGRRPEHFDQEAMLLWLRNRQAADQAMTYTAVCLENRDKAMAIRRTFGSWQRALDEACGSTDP